MLLGTDDESRWFAKPNAGSQRDFFTDFTNRYCAFVSGWRGGKSWAGARKTAILHCINAFTPDGRRTGCRGLIVSETYQLARTVNMPQFADALSEIGLKFHFIAAKDLYAFHVPELDAPQNPSYIFVRSAEHPEAIAGFDVGHLWGDEVGRWYQSADQPEQDAFFQATGRMSDKSANVMQANFTSTHESDETVFFDRFERAKLPGHRLYRGHTRDNEHNLVAGYVANRRSQLSPEAAEQYLAGGATSRSGSPIYNQFDESVHVMDCSRLDQRYPILLSFDFGINPGSFAVLAQEISNTIFIRREFTESRANARALSSLIVDWMDRTFESLPRINDTPWKFPGEVQLFGDASGKNAGLADGAKCWEEVFAQFGQRSIPCNSMNIPRANPRISDRAVCMNSALRAADGTVRLYMDRSCENLIKDMRLMRWAGNKQDKRDSDLSHAGDSAGYMVFQLMPVK
jgi:hypothetical protein